MDLLKFNLNLLHTIRAINKHRSLTEAAKELGLKQSSVSQKLQTVRNIFNDQIFEQRPGSKKYFLTPRGKEIVGAVEKMLKDFETAISMGENFNFETSTRVFEIAISEYVSHYYLPAFEGMTTRIAENLAFTFHRVNYRPNTNKIAVSECERLLNRELDFILFEGVIKHEGISGETLLSDEWVFIAKEDLETDLEEGQKLTAEHLIGYKIAVPFSAPELSLPNDPIKLRVPSIPEIPLFIQQSKSKIGLVPRKFAELHAKPSLNNRPGTGLKILMHDLELPPIEIKLYQAIASNSSEDVLWLGNEIKANTKRGR